MNGYVCFYEKQRIELEAECLYGAKLKAIEAFKVPRRKRDLICVVLAEKDGETVIHETAEL